MKIQEAKEIVGSIVAWQFVLQGVNEREQVEKIDLDKYSLEDLIKANKLVKANNDRKIKMQRYYQKKNGKANPITLQTVLSDRLIAGIYSILKFSSAGRMEVLINDKALVIINAKYD